MKTIKEKTCYVAADFAKEEEESKQSSEKEVEYVLPNLERVKIPHICRIKCPELLFAPTLNGLANQSI